MTEIISGSSTTLIYYVDFINFEHLSIVNICEIILTFLPDVVTAELKKETLVMSFSFHFQDFLLKNVGTSETFSLDSTRLLYNYRMLVLCSPSLSCQ